MKRIIEAVRNDVALPPNRSWVWLTLCIASMLMPVAAFIQ
jgi:hypothetical protein